MISSSGCANTRVGPLRSQNTKNGIKWTVLGVIDHLERVRVVSRPAVHTPMALAAQMRGERHEEAYTPAAARPGKKHFILSPSGPMLSGGGSASFDGAALRSSDANGYLEMGYNTQKRKWHSVPFKCI
ncbi:hypothetical protein E2C01_011605 [Portunus trituberculatus]|uniref:Uncharacterized protein n=1 Tax=Portunus trituberculatus TaxID=210409 RepID=A0A5B7DBL0_PORTR|nr:hypothetical protein [Portunus trituberculatus]